MSALAASTSIRFPPHVVVGQARQVRDFRRERAAGVVAVDLRLVVEDLDDASLEGIREGQHRDLNDGVVPGTEPRRLAVDVEAPAKFRVPRVRDQGGERERMQGAGLARFTTMSHGSNPRG